MLRRLKSITVVIFLTGGFFLSASAQDSLKGFTIIPVTDANFIMTFSRPNDVRLILGGQGSGLSYQTTKEHDFTFGAETYKNVSDLVGFGLTYKIIDFDLMFSLPDAHLLPDDRQNLQQFRLSMSYTARKNSFRGYLSESTGVISSEPEGDFESTPDVHLFKIGAQITHIFNSDRYSYRAANFQSELQRKTAGSFLLRLEPFYRKFGANTALAPEPRDIHDIFGNQAGLKYVNAPGVVLLPGYGINVAISEGKFFFSPMILAGPGIAFNTYKADAGKFTTVNLEVYGSLTANTGYNGPLMYVNLRTSYDLTYSYLNPSYFNTADIKIYLTVGYRFRNLEKVIPTGFF